MAELCGIVGIGQTELSAKRIDVSMPGLVRVVDAKVGQTVTKGDRLAVLEAILV